MVYLITGKLVRQDILMLPHDQYAQLAQTKMLPSLRILTGDSPGGRVLAGGVPAGSRNLTMIVELAGDSHRPVRNFLMSLPMFEYYEWETIPLETFEEMARAFGA